ncbi:MAG: DNA polymerase III subunit delta', partial [Thermodesulfobacteriota bacterium]|nr:DNA polymerase III subunit delta' [Thermodesulfobacteriota bacterium]
EKKPMSFKDVMGHERPINLLQRAIAQDKVVHSYLFLGNEGIGKTLVALQFAKALNCLEGEEKKGDACDHCPSCKKIDHRLHPDVMLIEPEGQTLKVDQVREMQRELSFRPYEGKRRVCILTAADRMAPNMSNALLKTLEEPPLHTVIILLANNPRLMLPTILSRCQLIRFNPLPTPSVSHWLMKEKGFEEKEAHLLASLSEGSPGKALEIQEEISQIPRKELLKSWVGLKFLSIEEKDGWVEFLPSKRENLLLILEVVKTLLRDLIMVKASKEVSTLIHSDLSDEIETVASQWNLPSLLNRMEILHQTSQAIKGNANTRLALEAMMLSWAEG